MYKIKTLNKISSVGLDLFPRDLYDVWYLWDKGDKRKALDIFPEKCRFKDVKIIIGLQIIQLFLPIILRMR